MIQSINQRHFKRYLHKFSSVLIDENLTGSFENQRHDLVLGNYCLDSDLKCLLQGLVKAGYVRGSTLLGAPYDFRKAANEQGFN